MQTQTNTHTQNKAHHGGVIEELLICRHGQQVFLEDALGLENISKAVRKRAFCHHPKHSLQRNTKKPSQAS